MTVSTAHGKEGLEKPARCVEAGRAHDEKRETPAEMLRPLG
jgi:hypothetical protein